jgi:hypothetical protein
MWTFTNRENCMRTKFGLSLLIAAMALVTSGLAGEINSDAGTTSFPFLKIGVGARAVAMGGAFAGLANDASAMYYNPAGPALSEHDLYTAEYHNYFMDIQSGYAAFVKNLDEVQALSAYASYLNYGEFIESDTTGSATGNTFGGGDMLLAAGYARRLGRGIQAGLVAKFLYEKVGEYSASGVAVDLGASYVNDRQRFGAGLAIQNLGKQMGTLGDQKYDLPLAVRGGVFYRPRGLSLLLTSDIILPTDNDPVFAIGGEYDDLKPLYIRMGWNSFGSNYRTADSDDSWAGLTFGFGVDFKQFQLSYAFMPAAELGESHRISLAGKILK